MNPPPTPTTVDAQAAPTVEHDGIVRVYRKEPQIAYVSDPHHTARAALRQAREHVQEHFADRVAAEDIDLVADDNETDIVVKVLLHAPTMKGEFKNHRHAADWLCRQAGWNHTEVEIVAKNSRRDHEIRAFGVKRQS